jgi:hypothetical protein
MFAIIDNEDYDELSKFKWSAARDSRNSIFYATRTEIIDGKRKTVSMHRLVAKTPENKHTDHINGDGLDNRKSNLRICTVSQNGMNRTRSKRRMYSKYKGVSKCTKISNGKTYSYWQVRIGFDKKTIWVGEFDNEVEAAIAYNTAALKYHGNFANLNKIIE